MLFISTFTVEAGRCTGSKSCRACKNCKYCKHCNEGGGTCGVCSPSVKKTSVKYTKKSKGQVIAKK